MKTLQKYWFLLLLFAVALILIFIRLSNQKADTTLQKISLDPSVKPSAEITGRISDLLSLKGFKLPKKLEIFSVSSFSEQKLPNNFIKTMSWLGIDITSPTTKKENFIEWIGDNSYSYIVLPEGSFFVLGRFKVTSGFSSGTAKQFVVAESTRLGLVSNVYDIKIKPLKEGGNEFIETTENDADSYSVKIIPSVNGFPMVKKGQGQTFIEFRLSKNGELLSLEYSMPQAKESIGEYPTKTGNEIISELKMGRAQILWVEDSKTKTTATLKNLGKILIENGYVAYKVIPTKEQKETLQPVVVFEGKTEDGSQKIFLFVPAIKGISI